MVIYIKVGKDLTKTLCILDTGSSQTSIDEDFARSLGIPLSVPKTRTLAYLDREATLSTSSCTFELTSQDQTYICLIQAEAVKGFSNNCKMWPWSNFLVNHPHLQGIKVPLSPVPPLGTVIIGTDNPDLHTALEYRRSARPGRPVAIRTVLGWGFFGPDPPGEDASPADAPSAPLTPAYKTTGAVLADIINRQFDLENIGALEQALPPSGDMSTGPKAVQAWTPEERLAETMMSVTPEAGKEGLYYRGRIPWKNGHHSRLVGNFHGVKTRQEKSHTLQSLEKKGVRSEEVSAILAGYLEKGYIEAVPAMEERQGWYLPFFEVVNRQKSTPIRLVFDAKARHRGVSLNQEILDTPNRLRDLTIVLTRMRRYRFVLAGDITEMFLQIRLHDEDKQYHRFLHEGKHYQWTRILFGNKASPNLSQKVLQTLCERETGFPQARETVEKSCYMDDCIDSRDSEKELVQLAIQLPALLKKAGMTICKMYSNSQKTIAVIPPPLVAKGMSFKDKDPVFHAQKVLGLVYDPVGDKLTYDVRFNRPSTWRESLGLKVWTKRGILQTIASHYDPLGLAAPLTIGPRRFFQKVWSKELEWDDPLEPTLQESWETELRSLLRMRDLSFPRWTGSLKRFPPQLHVYCDASSETYACALYLRTQDGENITTSLLAAKARVTSTKAQSVSRSELDACVLGARMARHYNAALELSAKKIFFYTDSTNALFWLTSSPKSLKVFVQRRVAEILALTEESSWGHVPTGDNPADIPTRIVDEDFQSWLPLWKHGPMQLRDPQYCFAPFQGHTHKVPENYSDEIKETVLLSQEADRYHFVYKLASRLSVGRCYDGYRKLIRILGLVCRAFKGPRPEKAWQTEANNLFYRAAQSASFLEDVQRITEGRRPNLGGNLHKWAPFVDDAGVLRSRSRLEGSSHLDLDFKYPAILSAKERLTRLMVESYHRTFKHPIGTGLMLAKLQKRCVILGLRRFAQDLTNSCVICRKLNPGCPGQLMGPISADISGLRQRAFAVIGIDFAGPFHLKGAGRGLRAPVRSVLVITCLQTRAVHFEVCGDQTTYAVVMALIRFASLRGDPDVIYSDNQTSFLGTRKEIENVYRDKQGKGPLWKTITPRAPHQGGRWERMVRAMKRALKVVGGSALLKEEEFITVLHQAADLLNSRPLSLGTSGDLSSALTPNHFLVGRIDTRLAGGKVRNATKLLGIRYRYLQRTLDELWARFMDEVLVLGREREKWRTPRENLRVGMPVLVLSAEPLKKEWTLGLVTEVLQGPDGYIRSAMVRTPTGELCRAVIHLVPLPDPLPDLQQREQ